MNNGVTSSPILLTMFSALPHYPLIVMLFAVKLLSSVPDRLRQGKLGGEESGGGGIIQQAMAAWKLAVSLQRDFCTVVFIALGVLGFGAQIVSRLQGSEEQVCRGGDLN
jgi:hypothetical protein